MVVCVVRVCVFAPSQRIAAENAEMAASIAEAAAASDPAAVANPDAAVRLVAGYNRFHRCGKLQKRKSRAVRVHMLDVVRAVAPSALVPAFKQAPMRRNPLSVALSRSFGMLHWPKIQDRLKSKSHANPYRFSRCIVLENGTTKICVECGKPNHNVGGARVFRCHACRHVGGRDPDAAVKIGRANLLVLAHAWRHIDAHSDNFSLPIQHYVRICKKLAIGVGWQACVVSV